MQLNEDTRGCFLYLELQIASNLRLGRSEKSGAYLVRRFSLWREQVLFNAFPHFEIPVRMANISVL